MDPNIRPQVSRPPSATVPPQGPPPLSNIQQQPQQQHQQYPVQHSPYGVPQPHPQQHTLPPLQHPQTHSPVPHSYLGGQPYRQDPRYPTTSANDVYAASSASLPPHTAMPSLPPSSYLGAPHGPQQQQQQQQFHSPGMMPQNTTAQAYPQLIAPAPPRDRRPEYGVPSPYGHGDNKPPGWGGPEGTPTSAGGYMPKEPPRTQVVGSQGRRGILPSVPGRAAAVTNGVNGNAKNNTVPAKDSDGKFPCPHCNKTYLHAKHLKRHLLRHTGDRPYMCVLCKDTFSRSDILKRHFQKCSLRRGNPTGVSHLSHPHAHLKRAQAAGVVPKPVQGDVSPSFPHSNGPMSTTFGEGAVNWGASHQPRFAEQRHQGHLMSSVNGLSRGQPDQVIAPNQAHQRTSRIAEPKQNSYVLQSGTDTVNQLNVDLPPIDPSKGPAGHDGKRVVPPGQNPGHAGEIDWSSMLQPGAHEGYMNPVFPSTMAPVNDGMHPHVEHPERKFYPAATSGHQENGGLNGLYLASTSLGGDGMLGSSLFWHFDMAQVESLQTKTERLIDFCFPGGLQEPYQQQQQPDNDTLLKECLTVDNVKHFLNLFANYHGHWPFMHIPTFDFYEAFDGLALAMCCVGAVYSSRVTPDQVRELMDRTRSAYRRKSRILRWLHPSDPANGDRGLEPDILLKSDIEEMQGLFCLHTLGTWNGNPAQRAQARQDIPVFARFARHFNLLSPAGPEDVEAYSPFHNMPSGEPIGFDDWNWRTWVEQEKRSRLLYMFFTHDTAQVLYFNRHPHFNPQEIKVPLPCDDAAWEAQDPQQCAEVLGFMGQEIQSALNLTGSLRVKQLEMHYALSAIQSPVIEFRPATTNVYGKFILVHALLEQVWLAQRQLYYEKSEEIQEFHDQDFAATSIYNPLPRHTWEIVDCDSVSDAAPNPSVFDFVNSSFGDGQASTQVPDAELILSSTREALAKWKTMWDQDIVLQYPPGTRRFGITRDALHFYWLGQALVNSDRVDEWCMDSDARFTHVIQVLNQTKAYTQVDVANRGEGLGSVADVDEGYGVDDLTFDMKKLFAPLE